MLIEYDGTDFAGWQPDPGKSTVGGAVAEAIGRLAGGPQRISVAGRTDAGVHATGQVISLRNLRKWSPDQWRQKLNRILPPTIGVKGVWEVDDTFDARRDALWRRYCYRIVRTSTKPVFGGRYVRWWYGHGRKALAIAAVERLHGRHDFAGMTLKTSQSRERDVDVRFEDGVDEWRIVFQSRSFLTRQVRFMVGAIVAVAREKLSLSELERVLRVGERHHSIAAAPASGLSLVAVGYPEGNPLGNVFES